ncbi:MAG TPA: acyl-CoA dehydrogenase family protein [Pseudonocardia sp.]
MESALNGSFTDLDIPLSAYWAAADVGLDGARDRVAAALRRSSDFAEGLWDVDARWDSDLSSWTALCAQHGNVLGDRERFAELGVLIEAAGRTAAGVPVVGTALAAIVLSGRDSESLTALRSGTPGALAWEGPGQRQLPILSDGHLDGGVEFVFDGGAAQVLVAVAADADGRPLVCRVDDAAGVGRQRRAVADPTRDLVSLRCDRVPVTVLADGSEAAALLAELESAAAVAMALDALGSAQAALDLAVEYAKRREQFGKLIGSYQAVAHHCSNMFMLVENARSLTRMAAWAHAWQLPDAALAASQAKHSATENAVEVGRIAIQVHGGIGMTWARPTHVHYKRAWVDRAALGSARHHRERIAVTLSAADPRNQPPMYRTPF